MRKGNPRSGGKGKRFSSESSGSRKKIFKKTDSSEEKKSGRGSDERSFRNKSSEGKFEKRKPARTERSVGSFRKRTSEDGNKRGVEGKPLNKRKAGDSFTKRKSSSEEKSSFRKNFPPNSRFDKPQSRPFQSTFESKKYSSRKKAANENEVNVSGPEKIRLNKFISNSGVCSRREADELIQMGLITVNGKVVSELGFKVNPGDEVRYENKVLRAEKPVYILLNKPKGFITTTNDPQERDTVMHIIGKAVKERVYPVGRLDRNTTGLLLLTNDGDLADKLTHPSYNVKKIYKVELSRPLTKADFEKIRDGVRLEEGKALVDDLAIISDDGRTVGLELHIGWNRIVRRIFEALEYEVVKLDRSVYAGLDKKDLPRGKWRFLRKEEVIKLKHFQ